MSNDTILTDDFVAGILAKEANDASIRYSSIGLEAFRSAKPANKAKPNTRFLGRIIKETTSHNAALLAKEAAEAQARLDDLTEAEEKKRRKLNPSSRDIRRRQLGDISSILLGRKRARSSDETDGASHDKDTPSAGDKEKRISERDHRRKEDRRRSDKEPEDRTRDRRSHRSDRNEDKRTREGRRHRDRSRSPASEPHRHRQRSPLSDDDDDHDDRRRRRRRSGRGPDRSGGDLIQNDLLRRKRHGRLTADEDLVTSAPDSKKSLLEHPTSSSRRRLADGDDESDPLDDLIGPALPPKSPVQRRGRGMRGAAAMDSRFSDGYDPQSDAQTEPEDTGNWDEAVEEFRDRQKWKQQGADRLRAAGFTEDEIKKWEKGGEKDIDDVRWTKAGEKREWDRGKAERP
ncbi:hypothetical protein B0T16DRAFT_399052 [Cercophora newfieldiana]|uniref:Pre-mRNA-splicing factor 38B n=1 Tax=Cercophora newfieldiana TaxID=92897 RepID=A0AA39YPH7_9PEZI|nr:hypothetical protein B0T16DRAFT_399052 [Cercophora newfieldiana]